MIRSATIDDASKIFSIGLERFSKLEISSGWTIDTVVKLINQGNSFLYENNEILAFCLVSDNCSYGDGLLIEWTAVSKGVSSGIGAKLFLFVFRLIKEKYKSLIFVDVCENRTDVLKMLTSFGFAEIEKFGNFHILSK